MMMMKIGVWNILRGRRKLYTFLLFYLPCLLHDKIVCVISATLVYGYMIIHTIKVLGSGAARMRPKYF